MPWKETPEEQVQAASLFEFFHHAQYHGGRQPWLSWWDPTGQEPSRLPVVCLQPAVHIRENGGFARNAQWAFLEPFLTTEGNGEPLEKDLVKQYCHAWVGPRTAPGMSESNTPTTTTARCEV